MRNQKPVTKINAGTVSCSLWQNEILSGGQVVTVLRATLERRYKDKDGEWKSSGSFSRNEIPLAIHCLQKAFEAMLNGTDAETSDQEFQAGRPA